ncbi:MAG TPA: acyl-CoA dehydrogenase family protein [Candidatus Thermoplasmatota archaeon]|nr:acyl-CoA dehydrogenase family protein [Candidatus Thermoplasmatota archaeon]
MSFPLTEEQELVRKTVAEFADARVAPQAVATDRERRFPGDLLREMAGLGLLGMLVDPKWGGAGTDTVSFVLATEEIARRCGSTAAAFANVNALANLTISRAGSDELRGSLLPELTAGRKLPAWALAEPGAGSDIAGVATIARKDGDEHVLNGLKSFVVGAGSVDEYVVFAREGKELVPFVVPSDAKGLAVGKPERSMTLRGAVMAQVFLKDVRVPSERRLQGDGVEAIVESSKAHRLAVSAIATGLMAASLELCRGYAGERSQFRQPIKNFQAIQWKVAEMDVRIRAARMLTLAAARRRDEGKPYDTDAAAAKLFAGEAAKWVTQEAIRLHGGAGFMREVPLERYNRDARATSILGGTSEIQRALLAADLLGL